MSWILGFGIPVVYFVIGFYTSRAVWRSRHKRGLNDCVNDLDTKMACFFMVWFWPLFCPVYFLTVLGQKKGVNGNVFERFYNHNLPESNHAKEERRRQEKYELQSRIRDLEYELGIR